MQLKESYTLLEQMTASKDKPLPLAAQRWNAIVAIDATKLETEFHMATIVYLYNTIWVANALELITVEPSYLEIIQRLMNEAKVIFKADGTLKARHKCAARSVATQYLWLLQELSQSSYIKVHRELEKRNAKSAPVKRTSKTKRR